MALDLSQNKLGKLSLRRLADWFASKPPLTYLHLEQCGLTDALGAELFRSLAVSRLRIVVQVVPKCSS